MCRPCSVFSVAWASITGSRSGPTGTSRAATTVSDGVTDASPRSTANSGDHAPDARDGDTGSRSSSETPRDEAGPPEIFQTGRICSGCRSRTVRGIILQDETVYSCRNCGTIDEVIE